MHQLKLIYNENMKFDYSPDKLKEFLDHVLYCAKFIFKKLNLAQ